MRARLKTHSITVCKNKAHIFNTLSSSLSLYNIFQRVIHSNLYIQIYSSVYVEVSLIQTLLYKRHIIYLWIVALYKHLQDSSRIMSIFNTYYPPRQDHNMQTRFMYNPILLQSSPIIIQLFSIKDQSLLC